MVPRVPLQSIERNRDHTLPPYSDICKGLVFSISCKDCPGGKCSMRAYSLPAKDPLQNQYCFLIVSSSPEHVWYSSVCQELIFSCITVEFNPFPN